MSANKLHRSAQPEALLNLRINMSGVGILPARKYIETGKMPSTKLARCHQQNWQDAINKTGKMPSTKLARCHQQNWQDAINKTGKMPVPQNYSNHSIIKQRSTRSGF